MTNLEPGVDSQQTPDPVQHPPIAQDALQQPATQINQTQPKPARNVLALVALITSILGFIFACIPGALIVGWILLPIGFILAIVSLFLKGRGKALGVAGLVISVVGTIVAAVVFFAVIATSFNDAFGDGETTVSEAPAESGVDTDSEALTSEAGTRENPVPLGTTISNDDWTVVVNSYAVDGNALVAANDFNEAPPAGSHFEVANYTVTYTGEESSYGAEVQISVVTGSGNVVNSFDQFVVLDDSMGLDELFNGASATGSVAFLVPDGEPTVVRVNPGILSDDLFVATQ